LKIQVRRFTFFISPTYDQSIFTVDPGKNINLVPLDGGLTCPKQHQNYPFFLCNIAIFLHLCNQIDSVCMGHSVFS
jgi:hypothetical protein